MVPSRKSGRGWRGSGILVVFFSNLIINSHQAWRFPVATFDLIGFPAGQFPSRGVVFEPG